MAELKEVVDELRRLENDRETLRRVHVYTKILAGKPWTSYCLLTENN